MQSDEEPKNRVYYNIIPSLQGGAFYSTYPTSPSRELFGRNTWTTKSTPSACNMPPATRDKDKPRAAERAQVVASTSNIFYFSDGMHHAEKSQSRVTDGPYRLMPSTLMKWTVLVNVSPLCSWAMIVALGKQIVALDCMAVSQILLVERLCLVGASFALRA